MIRYRNIMDATLITTSIAVFLFATLIFTAVYTFMAQRRRTTNIEREYSDMQDQRRTERERRRQQELYEDMLNELKRKLNQDRRGSNSGGYIIFDLKDKLRSKFIDLLKGFEEYAKLKGYSIAFSVDTSMPNKIAFKFTLQDQGVNVSTQTVRNDIREYIEKVRRGDEFDDLPIIISPEEHRLILTELKNRLKFIQYNFQLEKNAKEFYEKIINNFTLNKGIFQSPPVIIQTGEHSLSATNSSSVVKGESIGYSDHSDNSISNIVISNSFNKKKEQIGKLDEIISLLRSEKKKDKTKTQEIITNFDKVKDELEEEEKPDKKRIYNWMMKAKGAIKNVVLTHETHQAIKWIFNSFGIDLT